jgi:NAD-dependent SIR2 family protein deacetylase
MSKTVFILGAGFSAPAKIPVQRKIISEIVNRESQNIVKGLYTTLFGKVIPAEMANVPLEDVFTMLDRARISKEAIHGFSQLDIDQSYNAMIKSIIQAFDRKLSDFDDSNYLSFFQELIKKRISDGNKNLHEENSASIITLNWDTICDYMLQKIGNLAQVKVDYGCYDYDLENNNDHIPSIMLKAGGKLNFKLLKLHGSLNWLICTCCGRLFSANSNLTRPPVILAEDKKCSFCKDIALENLIITPTLVKDLNNTHLKMIWQNAFTILQESQRIVFIGYSFPTADFEFRYILLKSIIGRKDLSVRVVLYPPDDKGLNQEQKWKRNLEQERYEDFFGSGDIKFTYLDAKDFMNDPYLIWNW